MDVKASRIEAIDIAKGLAVVLMILGHAELFLNSYAYIPRVLDEGEYLPVDRLYNFVLYIVQSSVDAFYFFAGVGVAFAASRAESLSALRKTLWKRAWFLILLDLTVISWTYGRSLSSWQFVFGSIGVFAVSFMVMSFMLGLKTGYVAIIAGFLLLAREMLIIEEPFDPESISAILYGVFWGPVDTKYWSSLFTVLSWLPIVLLGFCFGQWLLRRPERLTIKTTLWISGLFFTLFGIFRVFFQFGSLGQPLPSNWVQVFQLEKYPASIHFHLLNLGFVFFYLFLALQASARGIFDRISAAFVLFGRQMLFVYTMHLVLLAVLRFLPIRVFETHPNLSTYLGFVVVMGLLIPLTYQYDQLKRRYRARLWLL